MTDKLITKLTKTCFRIANNMFAFLYPIRTFENCALFFMQYTIENILSLLERFTDLLSLIPGKKSRF